MKHYIKEYVLLFLVSNFIVAEAKTKEEWALRTIYQLLTDRFFGKVIIDTREEMVLQNPAMLLQDRIVVATTKESLITLIISKVKQF